MITDNPIFYLVSRWDKFLLRNLTFINNNLYSKNRYIHTYLFLKSMWWQIRCWWDINCLTSLKRNPGHWFKYMNTFYNIILHCFYNKMLFLLLQIIEVEMPFDKTKNQRKGFCFITFESEQVVNELLKTPKQTISGKEVSIMYLLRLPTEINPLMWWSITVLLPIKHWRKLYPQFW